MDLVDVGSAPVTLAPRTGHASAAVGHVQGGFGLLTRGGEVTGGQASISWRFGVSCDP